MAAKKRGGKKKAGKKRAAKKRSWHPYLSTGPIPDPPLKPGKRGKKA